MKRLVLKSLLVLDELKLKSTFLHVHTVAELLITFSNVKNFAK